MKTPVTNVMFRLVTSATTDKEVIYPSDMDKNKISA
jgi:hypothetical protein